MGAGGSPHTVIVAYAAAIAKAIKGFGMTPGDFAAQVLRGVLLRVPARPGDRRSHRRLFHALGRQGINMARSPRCCGLPHSVPAQTVTASVRPAFRPSPPRQTPFRRARRTSSWPAAWSKCSKHHADEPDDFDPVLGISAGAYLPMGRRRRTSPRVCVSCRRWTISRRKATGAPRWPRRGYFQAERPRGLGPGGRPKGFAVTNASAGSTPKSLRS